MKKLAPLLIILFWISMTFLLVYRHAPISGLGIDAQILLPESKERWMGIYLEDKKVGFTSNKFQRNIEGYTAREETRVRLMLLGTEQDVRTVTHVSLSPELKIRSFRFVMNAAQDVEIEGEVQDKLLMLNIKTAGSESRQRIQLDEVPQMSLTVLPYLLRKGFKTGMRMKFPVFDPATLSTQNMLIEIIGKEKIILHGSEIDAFKIKGDFSGLAFFMWVDEEGNELKEEGPMGFTLISEPMAEAIKLPGSVLGIYDMIRRTSVPFNLKLPSGVSYLKIRLEGIDLDKFELRGGRQALKGDILEIVKERISSFKYVSVPISGMEQFLDDTPFIQSKDQRIIDLARKIIDEEKDSMTVARLIWTWVFENIEKTPTVTIPSAVDVLEEKKGDCNEHTILYTALARSVGLPTRINVGLVYNEGFFYYHAWPEVFVGRWIAIDPTLGQFPADATHIRLISGDLDKQLILLRVINNISLEGIEYR